MDILCKDSLNKYVSMFLTLFLIFSFNTYAATSEQVLLKSYQKDCYGNIEESDKIISELETAIAQCQDEYLSSRIQYRIGVLEFGMGNYLKAYEIFNGVAGKIHNDDILMSALNMKAYSAQFSGKTKEANNCFHELVKMIENRKTNREFEVKLAVSGYFSIAQLYAQTNNIADAIASYSAFIDNCSQNESKDIQPYILKARKLRAQLIYDSGDIKGYMKSIKEIVDSDLPDDFKADLALQYACMKFIMNVGMPQETVSVAKIPTLAIEMLFNDPNCEITELVNSFEELRGKYKDSKNSIYINYVYAYLLDASGKKQDSINVFKNVIDACAKLGNDERYFYLGEYAKVQSSILMGELKDYNSAASMIDSVKEQNSQHLLQISEAVRDSLTTLKREVPKDAKI